VTVINQEQHYNADAMKDIPEMNAKRALLDTSGYETSVLRGSLAKMRHAMDTVFATLAEGIQCAFVIQAMLPLGTTFARAVHQVTVGIPTA